MSKKFVVIDYLWITFSALLTAFAVNWMFTSTGLAPGGITGLCIVFSTLTNISVDIMSLCVSVPLLILGILFLGKSFGLKTLYVTLVTPLFMRLVPAINLTAVFAQFHPWIELGICAIIGGILVGCSIGLALNHSCATGGTDLIALLIQKVFRNLKLSNILLVLDGGVVIASGFINHDVMIAIFSFFSLLVIIKTISFVTEHQFTALK